MAACTVATPWDERLLAYNFGAGHPLAPVRVELTMRLADSMGVLKRVTTVPFDHANDAELRLVHTAAMSKRSVPRVNHSRPTQRTVSVPPMIRCLPGCTMRALWSAVHRWRPRRQCTVARTSMR